MPIGAQKFCASIVRVALIVNELTESLISLDPIHFWPGPGKAGAYSECALITSADRNMTSQGLFKMSLCFFLS